MLITRALKLLQLIRSLQLIPIPVRDEVKGGKRVDEGVLVLVESLVFELLIRGYTCNSPTKVLLSNPHRTLRE